MKQHIHSFTILFAFALSGLVACSGGDDPTSPEPRADMRAPVDLVDMRTVDMSSAPDMREEPDMRPPTLDMKPPEPDMKPEYVVVHAEELDAPLACAQICEDAGYVCDGMYDTPLGALAGMADYERGGAGISSCEASPDTATTDLDGETVKLTGYRCYCKT